MRIRKLNVVDLFAGAGGFSLGAIEAGAKVAFAVESNQYAAATFRKNIAKPGRSERVTVYNTDITSLCAKKLAHKHFPRDKECDLLLGGPPCQGFSPHRINNAGVSDPRNSLIYEYFKFVAELRPRAFLMENVPGMLWPRHQAYVKEFYRQAAAHRYTVLPPVKLDARDYGVPQRRYRVFILGLRNDEITTNLTWPPHPTHAHRSVAESKKVSSWVPCLNAFLPAPPNDPNDVHMKHGKEVAEAFARTPHNGGSRSQSGRALKCHVNHNGHSDVYGRIDSTEPAPTMTTACINPSKGRFVHPTLNHGITARQAARIQTFPDDYIFEGGLISAGMQIGNAVPVALGKALIAHIAAHLSASRHMQLKDEHSVNRLRAKANRL